MSATATDLCGLCLDVDPDCDHDGPRVLGEIRYERAESSTATAIHWHVPDHERARIERPPSTWPTTAPRHTMTEAAPLQALIAQLDNHLDLDDPLEGLLRETYAHDPLKTSRLVSYIIGKCESRELRSPGGFLATRLHDLTRKK